MLVARAGSRVRLRRMGTSSLMKYEPWAGGAQVALASSAASAPRSSRSLRFAATNVASLAASFSQRARSASSWRACRSISSARRRFASGPPASRSGSPAGRASRSTICSLPTRCISEAGTTMKALPIFSARGIPSPTSFPNTTKSTAASLATARACRRSRGANAITISAPAARNRSASARAAAIGSSACSPFSRARPGSTRPKTPILIPPTNCTRDGSTKGRLSRLAARRWGRTAATPRARSVSPRAEPPNGRRVISRARKLATKSAASCLRDGMSPAG